MPIKAYRGGGRERGVSRCPYKRIGKARQVRARYLIASVIFEQGDGSNSAISGIAAEHAGAI